MNVAERRNRARALREAQRASQRFVTKAKEVARLQARREAALVREQKRLQRFARIEKARKQRQRSGVSSGPSN